MKMSFSIPVLKNNPVVSKRVVGKTEIKTFKIPVSLLRLLLRLVDSFS